MARQAPWTHPARICKAHHGENERMGVSLKRSFCDMIYGLTQLRSPWYRVWGVTFRVQVDAQTRYGGGGVVNRVALSPICYE